MSRIFKIQDEDWGEKTLFVIYEREDGTWEPDWEVFRVSPELLEVSNLFSRISYEAYQDALRNHGINLIKELGLAPEACLLKQKEPSVLCAHRSSCSMHDKRLCRGNHKKVPLCYESGTELVGQGVNVARVYEMWRNGIYVIITKQQE